MAKAKMARLTLLQVVFGLLRLSVTEALTAARPQAAVACQQLQAALGNFTLLPSQIDYLPLSTENWCVFWWIGYSQSRN